MKTTVTTSIIKLLSTDSCFIYARQNCKLNFSDPKSSVTLQQQDVHRTQTTWSSQKKNCKLFKNLEVDKNGEKQNIAFLCVWGGKSYCEYFLLQVLLKYCSFPNQEKPLVKFTRSFATLPPHILLSVVPLKIWDLGRPQTDRNVAGSA